MEINDFFESKYAEHEGNTTIWGEETGLLVDCDGITFEEMLPLINNLLQFLENNKPTVVKALIDKGMLQLAEYWVENGEETEDSTDEHPSYVLYDGSTVTFPITEENFSNSLHLSGMNIDYYEDKADISADIFIDCEPDYFAGHSIEIFMDSKGNIEVNGLAG